MFKYLSLLVWLTFYRPGIDGVYHREMLNSGMDRDDDRWELILKPDSSFTYSFRHKRAMILKEDTFKMRGWWSVKNDTLTLKSFSRPFVVDLLVRKDSLRLAANNVSNLGSAFNFGALAKR